MFRLKLATPHLAAAALAAFALTAGAAEAKGPSALSMYTVSGKNLDTDALARAGYDVLEGSRAKGGIAIVATAAQAQKLKDDGNTVRPSTGRTAGSDDRAITAADPFAGGPDHGYNVFRPWSLTPEPCPDTCETDRPVTKNLKTLWAEAAAANSSIVKAKQIGTTTLTGQPIMAYRVTTGANTSAEGSKPAVLFEATQHAREWISAEVNYRLFQYVLAHKADADTAIPDILDNVEMWFIPIVNPDGYDFTFMSPETRLWRKNLRDVNGDGSIDDKDGVDPNRNWPTHWNFDLEGASADPTSETYHGTAGASEKEVQAARGLIQQIKPKFMIDYHSFAQLILYPFGFQVETPSNDAPLLAALAGNDRVPAVEGFDPDVSAELYTTNGDVTDDAITVAKTMAYTVELDGGSGADVGGTKESIDPVFKPAGFVYQDSETDIAAEAAKNFPFALDLAASAQDPEDIVSHLGNTYQPLNPTTFTSSYGTPQTVEVNALKSLGDVRLKWTTDADGDTVHSGPTKEYAGGSRYGGPGVYFHKLRGQVVGVKAGDNVRVWFEAGGKKSKPFTYLVKQTKGGDVLLMAAEDASGNSADPPTAYADGQVKYLTTFKNALDDARVSYDVWDVDGQGRQAPSALGVLSHYKAVVWYTGDDLYVRQPGQPGGTGTSKLLDDEVLATRDYLNDGGHLLVNGKLALQGGWDQFLFNPLEALADAPFCNSNQATGNGDADDPPGQPENCIGVSNDFQQYWLGAYLPITTAASVEDAAALPFKTADGSIAFTLNGEDSAKNQDTSYSLLTTSSILPKATYPQFSSDPQVQLDRPPSFDPPEGTKYARAESADEGWQRLRTTVDLTGKTSGELSFKTSYDVEPGYDAVFVEAHTVGQDDWTTLPDANGHTANDDSVLASCDIDWITVHPFVAHYQSNPVQDGGDEPDCTSTGTTGEWNAATGNSAGFQDWKIDLTPYAGKQVELSITYAQDFAVSGLGVFVDDVKIKKDGAVATAFGFEDGTLGPFTAGPAPGGGTENTEAKWAATSTAGLVDAPGVKTANSVYWGFGLEGVTGRATRSALLLNALKSFDVKQGPPVVPPGRPGTTPPPATPAPPVTSTSKPPISAIVKFASASTTRLTKLGSMKVRVRCPANVLSDCKIKVTLKGKVGGRTRTLGSKSATLKKGAAANVVIKLSSATRKAIRKAKRLKVAASLTGTAGTTKLSGAKTITVRP